MKRSCTKIPINDYINELGIFNTKNVSLYVDSEDTKKCDEIISFLENNRKKFLRILGVIISGCYNDDLYGREKVDSNTENITAMKFKGKVYSNTRIYCKEFFKNGKQVVMITILLKKVQKVKDDKTLKQRLKIIGGYEYEFKREY